MCLAIPGRIIELFERDDVAMGKIDYGGVMKEACLTWVPEARAGDYVLVHVGFALSTLDASEAEATLRLIDAMQKREARGDA